jgi:hypothetical protein
MRRTHLIAMTVWALVLVGGSAAQLGAETTERGGPSEGIKVHGHWTITVRDPDGGIVSRRDFENALISDDYGGNGLLAALLTRNVTTGLWTVSLNASTGPSACVVVGGDGDGTPVPCEVAERYGQLTLTRPTPTTIQLTGETRVNNSAATFVDSVNTLITACVATQAPQQCAPGEAGYVPVAAFFFSGRVLSPAIAIRPNQVIQFTVVFSFS